MSVRRVIVEADTAYLNVAEFCRNHGVSRWFFYDLRRRHGREGDVVLEPRSRAPHQVANKTPLDVEDVIVAMRKELDDSGLDAGAASIADRLRGTAGVPSEATIWRILKARGLITPEPAKAPRKPARSFTARRANECWQLDDTSWELADGTEVKILNIIDDHSRLLVASAAAVTCTGTFALDAMAQAAAVLLWPQKFLSDNAPAFKHVLAKAVAALGVQPVHSRPYHPQTCGKVERFHQTLKKWLTKQPAAETIEQLQTQLDVFRYIYNHQRPHRAISRRTPASLWKAAPKSGPRPLPADTTTGTWDAKVAADGRLWFNNNRVTIGTRHTGQHARIITTGTICHIFITGELTRTLELHPNQNRYPLPSNKDPHNV